MLISYVRRQASWKGEPYLQFKDLIVVLNVCLMLPRIVWAFIVFAALVTSIVLLWISWQYNAETPTTTVLYNFKTNSY